MGQIIAIGISSGGVFTENLQNRFSLNIPILLLCFVYVPLLVYLVLYYTSADRGSNNEEVAPRIAIKWFLLCAVIDVHSSMLIVYAYYYTSITSVMLLQDFTIPCVVFMSIVFLKVRYKCIHFIAIFICVGGLSMSICNDLFIKPRGESDNQKKSNLIGDAMSLLGAFGYGLTNIL